MLFEHAERRQVAHLPIVTTTGPCGVHRDVGTHDGAVRVAEFEPVTTSAVNPGRTDQPDPAFDWHACVEILMEEDTDLLCVVRGDLTDGDR
jgi:hypothetical protein